jgi:arylformamidase
MAENGNWIDISVPVWKGMVTWAGDSPVSIEHQLDMARGDVMNLTNVSMSLHTGTHMDAPRHFRRDGKTIDQMPLDATVGRARVIAIQDPESVKAAELAAWGVQPGERILFKTRNSERCWSEPAFVEDFVYISKEAAQMLAGAKVRMVGIDYLSVGGYRKDTFETHEILMDSEVWIIEGLDLAGVEPGEYELVCLPIKFAGCEGAPARAMVRRLAGS